MEIYPEIAEIRSNLFKGAVIQFMINFMLQIDQILNAIIVIKIEIKREEKDGIIKLEFLEIVFETVQRV